MKLTRAAVTAPALALAGLALAAAPAPAATVDCTAAHTANNCQSITDRHPADPPHALKAASATDRSRVVATALDPAKATQDWTIRGAASPVGSYVIKLAPNGDQGSLCLEEAGGLRSHVLVAACNGAINQRWYINHVDDPEGGWNIQNAATLFAVTHVPGHGVQVRHLGAGTALGKQWDVSLPPVA